MTLSVRNRSRSRITRCRCRNSRLNLEHSHRFKRLLDGRVFFSGIAREVSQVVELEALARCHAEVDYRLGDWRLLVMLGR